MGSQTLEILRQGVWASVTGGWFYDPHQNSFCNTVHLYIWLFLLCVPFTVYLSNAEHSHTRSRNTDGFVRRNMVQVQERWEILCTEVVEEFTLLSQGRQYFPPSIGGWTIYCTLVAFLFGFVKIVNHSLHHMYDTTECIVIPADNLPPNEKRRPTKKNRDEEGIELQMLGVGRLSVGNKQSDNESVTSLEYHKPTNSTIDLKVDVHRKNSSESSVEDNAGTHRKSSESADTKHDHSATATEASNVQKLNSTLARARHTYRRDRDRRRGRLRQADLGTDRSKIEELSSEEGLRMERCSKQEDAVAVNLDNEMPNTEVSRKLHRSLLKKGSQNRDFFKEWLYLDCAEPSGEPYLSKFARQLSSDSRDNSELSISGGQSSPNKKLPSHQHRYLNIYSGDGCTKSSIALAHPQANNQTSNMRRNSNSTMSTIQLPLLNSTAQLVSHMRRHSNVTNASLGFLPTGSVELGAYMMEKSADGTQHGKGKSKAKTKSSGVRRIKSAALEIGCPPPSVSNLSPHPNSVETIGGQVLKNPKSAILPPPSKSLIRNPHLNLYPKNNTNSGEGCSYPYLNYGSEIVYPIAEISDEMQTSQCQESDLESISSQSYSDYDDENANMRHQFRGFDWHPNQSVEGNTSDSDYENNGSRSPLLDRKIVNEVRIVKSKAGDKQDLDVKKHQASDKILNKNNSFSVDSKSSEKVKAVRLKKISKNNSFNVTLKEGTAAEDCDPRQRQSSETNVNIVSKNKVESENTEGNLSNAKGIPKMGVCDQSESHDKASASMLIEKPKVQTNECTFQQREKCATSDVTEKDNDRNELSNSSNSLEMHDATINVATETSDINEYKTETELQCKDLPVPPEMKEDIEVSSSKSSDENSLYNITWLFDESNTAPEKKVNETICLAQSTCCSPSYPKIMCIQPNLNVQKNLGAIPKQGKNLNRSRASSQKENKKKETKPKEKETEKTQEELMILDVVEAHTALVQGLESLFAAANTSTVALPMTKDERLVTRQCPQTGDRTRKRSIEEVAQSSTNTLLPTSMPLLAAFLNSRTESTNLPIYIPVDAKITCCGFEPNVPNVESQRTKPLMDRNHRNRIRKIKRSTRQRNNPQFMADRLKVAKLQKTDGPSNSSQVHVAKSFNDTTDGAIHSFIDEYGNWMSYTFDKNSSGQAVQTQPAVINEKEEKHPKMNRVKPLGGASSAQGNNVSPGSCVSLTSEAVNSTDAANKCTRNDSLDQSYTNGSVYNSSSNQGSNNPLLSSNNNSTTGLPGNSNSKKFYVFDGGTTSQNEQPRSPVNYVTDSLLEQIEAERQARLGIPSVHMSAMMRERENTHINMPVSGSIGDNSLDLSISRTRFRLLDLIDNSTAIQPLTYHKFKIFKCWEVKVTMDRLKLMALFDRNLTLKETFISIILAIMVAVLGSMVLNIGFYKDIYAFWFCFIMAGSQYSLLKSVQPDAASPVHGFNKMVAFSRPVYFCLCTGILFGIHSQLETYPDMQESKRFKRSTESASDTFVLYGLTIKEKDLLMVLEDVLSKFLLFFPLAFSLGLFPQVNTFLMYLFEQIDMHIFGGNATSSLTASAYCVVRSLLAIGVLYGFAFSGLIEPKGSQHILFSIFCALLIPTSYHLSRSASDYTLVWNLLKTHLLPPDLYIVHNVECSSQDMNKGNPETLSEKSEKKNNSESNISKQNSIGSSASKINFSSETNISKTQKRSHTSSVSSLKFENKVGDMINSSGSIKVEVPADGADREKSKQETEEKAEEEVDDPLPRKLQETVNSRLKNDVIVCSFMALFIFGIHCTTVFTTLQPELNPVVWWIAAILGWILHYLMPQLRKQQPWLCLSGPVLKAHEHTQYEVREQARLMWFEKAYVYLCFFERNLLYPVIFISAVTQDSPNIVLKFGPAVGALIVCVCALKCVRNAYSDPDSQYLILIFAVLLFQLDYSWASETFLVDYFLMAIVFNKMYEFLLKIQFIVTYIAPWQITWGSAFHAFAQPFSVPHSAMLFLQAGLSAILSTPLNPVLGSAIFMMSYVRPVKFWERDYNTKRVDQSNTRLSSQLERNLGADDNNLNSIFYEHLTRSLQHYLCGDLALGRWGQVQQGDCFVLASDYLNCLVHIVEMGNGLVSFQLRGLEFRGTYCQQREVEAISEGPEENVGCCCCAVGHLPRMLSVNAMFSLRWLAWQLTSVQYVLEGYSISDNSAGSLLQVFDFRKVLITYYVKSIIYYTIQSQKLEEWLTSPAICEALKATNDRNFVDLDPIFNVNLDEDYDFRTSGITRTSFCSIYHEWIVHCATLREDLYRRRGERLVSRDSPLVTLCFALSLVGRRSLGAASHNPVSNVEFFLYGLHALFKGDFRITSVRDEWVFSDMTLLHSVLAPAVRMALKLHQDHFMSPEEYSNVRILYTSISCYSTALVICHEAAPAWRSSVLRGAPHLLALRHVMDEGTDEYKIIMLNKRHLGFRVIRLNRECVRGLWAGQQHELVYLRNRNPERGSIQNAKQALRNIINSSCDQPIGYPIYVSPLTTSYAETSAQLSQLVGGALTLGAIRRRAVDLWRRIRRRCGEGCSSGSAAAPDAAGATVAAGAGRPPGALTPRHNTLQLSRTSLAGTRGSLASAGKPTSSTLASLAGLLGSSREHSLGPGALPEHPTQRGHPHEAGEAYTTIREGSSERKRRCDEAAGSDAVRVREGRHCGRTTSYSVKDGRQSIAKDRTKDSARRSKRDRERIRPASFRLLSAQERDGIAPGICPDNYEMHSLRDERDAPTRRERDNYEMQSSREDRDNRRDRNENYEMHSLRDEREGGSRRERDGRSQGSDGYDGRGSSAHGKENRAVQGGSREMRRNVTTKVRQPTPDSSLEDLTLNPSSLDVSGTDCKIIANRNTNVKYQPHHKRRSSDFSDASRDFPAKNQSERNIDNLTSTKDLSNAESCSEHCIPKPYNNELHVLAKMYRDMQNAGEISQIKTKVKRSDSLKTELKSHVSVGCKVIVVDPLGVYDCINLGRRIDVQWPSEYQRERGGRNHWGAWVPMQGMDGQVVHRWTPNHRDPKLRSHVDKTILLVQIDDRFVPIAENCVQDLGDEV